MIKIDFILGKGRGVMSTKGIDKGEIIEISPAYKFPSKERDMIDKTSLFQYYFVKQNEYNKNIKDIDGYMVFGLTSFCNHSDSPNAKVEWIENNIGFWCHLIATENIKPKEEITMFYANIDQYPFHKTLD